MNQARPIAGATMPARRTVVHGEALAWLAANPAAPATSVITSLPDVSEVPDMGFEGWRSWFSEAARSVIQWLPSDGEAIFFQSDIREAGHWVDKGYLVMRAAEAIGAHVVWHKIVCRKPPGTITPGRAGYSHMICIARSPRSAPARPGPDVIADAGPKSWQRGMGLAACKIACRYLRDETSTSLVVDPFCGEGSALAVANAFGFEALGVELSIKRCRRAFEQVMGAAAP